MNEKELMALAEEELRKSKLISEENRVLNGFIVRSLNAYPVIRKGYQEDVDIVKNFYQILKTFLLADQACLNTIIKIMLLHGLYAARNLENLANKIDIWKINSEGIYQEGDTEDKI